ncbi:MAG: hypothetical protein WD009_04190 [Phycisphaeraceae bacterium]
MTQQARETSVEHFVRTARRRLNGHLAWRCVRGSLLGGAAVMLVIALSYVARGHSVPGLWYPAVLAASLAVAAGTWVSRRLGGEQAELVIDRCFDLRDAVSSLRGLERAGRRGPLHDLHAAQVRQQVSRLHVHDLPTPPGHRLTAAAIGLALLAGGLGLIGPGAAVRQQQAEADRTRQHTQQINEELDRYVREMLAGAPKNETDLIDAAELRQWVEQLEAQPQLHEALRQYARFQQRVSRMSVALDRQRDEALLDEAAHRLQDVPEARHLAEQLEQKRYRDAAERLRGEQPTPEQELEEQRDRLDRLRQASRRMAEAARSMRGRRAGSGGSDSTSGGSGAGGTGDGAGDRGAGETVDDELAGLLEELDEAVDAYDEALAEYELIESQAGDALARLEEVGDDAGRRLQRLSEHLDELDAARLARRRLQALRRRLAEAQSELARGSASARLADAGGLEAGRDANPDSMDREHDTLDEGQLTKLTGQRSDGPALRSVESADSGTGVARRDFDEQAQAFERQVESFVQREDVPEPLRDGVRSYFQSIHEAFEKQVSR